MVDFENLKTEDTFIYKDMFIMLHFIKNNLIKGHLLRFE